MKKSLEAELMDLAEKILRIKNKADVHELKAMAAVLYEKLSVLSFAEKHFEGSQPTLTKKHVKDALGERTEKENSVRANRKNKDEDRYAPDGMHYNPEGITEPNTEKIKDIVAQMPSDSQEVEEVLKRIVPKKEISNTDLRNIGVHYDDLPQFEPVKNPKTQEETHTPTEKTNPEPTKKPVPQKDLSAEQAGKPTPPSQERKSVPNEHREQRKSLNDRLKSGVSFGLNERVVFIKHLFHGNVGDYDRVLSQLNTFQNYDEAKQFIERFVKPDYAYWEGEELYEKRFLAALKNKLN